MFKNGASQKIIVFAFDATTNVPKTGDSANITAYISKDFGSVTVLGDTSATEMDATNAPGYYLFDITQTETNADTILVSGKSSTANIKIIGAPATIFTLPTAFTSSVAQTGDSYARLGAPVGASTSADIAAVQADTDNIQTRIPAALTADGNIKADTLRIGGTLQTAGDVGIKTGFALTSSYDFAKGTTAMTESYAAQGAAMTPVQALYQLVQQDGQMAIVGTTMTVKKRDGSTTAKTYTLDSATAPTSITEAT